MRNIDRFSDMKYRSTFVSAPGLALLLGAVLVLGGYRVAAQVNVPIGNVQPGARITISFEVAIDGEISPGVTQLSSQGTITGSNFSALETDDPESLAAGDATLTPLFNAPPQLDLNGALAGDDATAEFSEQIAELIAPAGTLADPEGNPILSLTATLAARPDGDSVESLSLNAEAASIAAGAGLTAVYTPASGVLSLTGSADASVYQQVLRGILYENTSDTPAPAERIVSLVANDTNDGEARTVTITVTPINDLPESADQALTISEDVVVTFAPGVFTFTDVDGPSFGGIQVVTPPMNGGLLHDGSPASASEIIPDVTLLQFVPGPNEFGEAYAAFTFKVRDGAGGLSAEAYTMTINVNPVPDDPAGASNAVVTAEDASRTFSPADFPFSDADGHAFDGIELVEVATAGTLENDGLAITAGEWVQDVNQLLFIPGANASGVPYATFSFKVRDSSGALSAATYTMTINVTAVADLPSVTHAATREGAQTTSGLVIARNPVDGTEVTHFRIDDILNGTLFQTDGTTPIADGDFITAAEGSAGLKFTPAPGLYSPGTSFSFAAAGATSDTGDGLGPAASAIVTVEPNLDFGDAPDPAYPTLLASDGARHVVLSTGATSYLGAVGPDSEADAEQGALADGDDTTGAADEEGVSLPSAFRAGTDADLTVTVEGSGFLNGWIDFNRDGDWSDAGEQVLLNEALSTETKLFSVSVPEGASGGLSFARFRFSSQSGSGPTGQAPNGEVEDYAVTIQVNAAPVAVDDSLARYPNGSGKISIAELLVNDSDADNDGLTFTGVTSPGVDGATIVQDGNWLIYEPAPGSNLPDAFDYTISDGQATAIGTVHVTVIIDDDEPTKNILSITAAGDDVVVRCAGIPGRTYQLQTTTDLTAPITWTPHPAGPQIAAPNGIFEITDLSPPSPRYYRAVEIQEPL